MGNILRMESIPISGVHSAEFVEALGVRTAVTSLLNLGGNKVILEGDAQKIFRMLQGRKFNQCQFGSDYS